MREREWRREQSLRQPDRRSVKLSGDRAPPGPEAVLALQRSGGNRALVRTLHLAPQMLQRQGDEDEVRPEERSRRSRPRNAPSGTVPIDQSGLDRETIHKIKDAIGAGPRDWVGITPDGRIVTADADGNAQDEGHVSDYARNGAENIPKWVWGLLALAAVIAVIVLFATGVGELALVLAGVGLVAAAAIKAVWRATRGVSEDTTTAERETADEPETAHV